MAIFDFRRRVWRPADQRVQTQADVHALWLGWLHEHEEARELFAQPWDRPRLFLVMIRPDGRPSSTLHHVDWLTPPFSRDEAEEFAAYIADAAEDLRSVLEIALLFARPGCAQLTRTDLSMCQELYAAARRHELVLTVIHVAGDDGVTPVPMDALEAA